MDELWVNEISPWIKYPLKEWHDIISGHSPILHRKKSVIYNQGDASLYAYIVSSGRVRVSTFSMGGSEKQLFIAEQGCLFGEVACIMGFPHFEHAVCIKDSYIYCIPQSELVSATQSDQRMNIRIYNSVFRKNVIFRNQILELSFSSSKARIVHLLLNLCKQYGVSSDVGAHDSYVLNVSFTHSDIAGMVNTSRVTVNNTFTWLLGHDFIRKEGRHYVIPSKKRLEELADEETCRSR